MTDSNVSYMRDVSTPIGVLTIQSDGMALTRLRFSKPTLAELQNAESGSDHPVLIQGEQELLEYFAGDRKEFTVPLGPIGTAFQSRVWLELINVPFGQTISYGELAGIAGNPKASRAVGMANNKNKIGIIIPCHRVIGASGKLTGYAGGLWRKEYLLGLEQGRDMSEMARHNLELERNCDSHGSA